MVTRVSALIPRALLAAALAVLLGAPFAHPLTAGSFDERTVVTFSGSVQIPGQVLPAGTYVFKLSPIPLERDVVQILNSDENQVIATLFTVPVWRDTARGQSKIELGEATAGNPPPVHQFVYAGATRAHEFVYR
jgi:hypothetical protein